jgi:hypothetical protein
MEEAVYISEKHGTGRERGETSTVPTSYKYIIIIIIIIIIIAQTQAR